MKLSVTIMGSQKEAESAYALRDSLDRPARMILDDKPWARARRAWEMNDSFADYHVVLSAEVTAVPNLIDGLGRALSLLGPDALMSAFTGSPHPNQAAMSSALEYRNDDCWVSAGSLFWSVAVAAPSWTIPEMLRWSESREKWDYGIRIARYYRDILGWRTWYPYPSLVEYDGHAVDLAKDAEKVKWERPSNFSHLIDPSMIRFKR